MRWIRHIWIIGVIVLCVGVFSPYVCAYNSDEFLVLCFHDIPKDAQGDKYAVDRETFVGILEYLTTHEYHFVSFDDIIAAKEGTKSLPPRSVLLTFDDAYISFYEFVYPLLARYKYPCVLSVTTSWIEEKPETLTRYELMSWAQIREVAHSALVEVAAHSHELHQGVIYNPQGNEAWASVSRVYDAENDRYESDDEYETRVRNDLFHARMALKREIEKEARLFTWPYGRYNQYALAEAKKMGFSYTLGLNDAIASLDSLDVVNRIVIVNNPSLPEFISLLEKDFKRTSYVRCIQVDLDLLYDHDPEIMEYNLSRLLDRILDMRVTTVLLQAFADPDGTGNIRSVYFPNEVLPMRADLFNRVVHQLRTRSQVDVYAWMPGLSIVLPEGDDDDLRVRATSGDAVFQSRSWYWRLSPFHPTARQKIIALYSDLAKNSSIDGIVFNDDLYLNDFEDFNDAALLYHKRTLGKDIFFPRDLHADDMQRWTELKTDTLMSLTANIMKAVRVYRPEAKCGRVIYAPVLTHPESEEWFAQNYKKCLEAYDYVIVMAYPRMEEIDNEKKWLGTLVDCAAAYPEGLEKTMFKVQTYDWKEKTWIDTARVTDWLRTLVARGARHIAYYPDDYTVDKPDAAVIRTIMSVEDFPFERK